MRVRRRHILTAVVAAIAVVATACGADPAPVVAASGPPAPTEPVARELLFLPAPTSLRVVDVGTGDTVLDAPVGVVSADGSVVVGASPTPRGDGTDVVAWSSGTGEELSRVRVSGSFQPRVVSPDGSSVVLGPARSPVAPEVIAPGRPRTPLALVRFDGAEPRVLDVAGNVEPEAFTTDGAGVIVVDYLPPEAPDRYRVARLDLASGELSELKSPDAIGGAEMQGTARTQALSSDGARLYTLYSVAAGGPVGAFVHVLDLGEQWAHCIDLPQPFGSAPDAAFGVSLSTDGRRLWVADSSAETVAEIDTEALSVERSVPLAMPRGAEGMRPVLTSGRSSQAVYLAVGSAVTMLDPDSLEAQRSFDVDGDVRALRLGPDGRLAVVVGDKVLLFDDGPPGRG